MKGKGREEKEKKGMEVKIFIRLTFFFSFFSELIPKNFRDPIVGCWMLNPDSESFEFTGTEMLSVNKRATDKFDMLCSIFRSSEGDSEG